MEPMQEVATTSMATSTEATTTALTAEAHEGAAEHKSPIAVHLKPEEIGHIGSIPVTPTLITSWVVMAILVVFALVIRSRMSLVPGKLQLVFEEIISYIRNFVTEVLESKELATKYLPLLLTLFFFILCSNLLHFIPGVGSIGFHHGEEFIPLFASVNTDLNVTLALAIISVVMIEIAGIAALGFFKYGSKFINFSSPLNFVVGIIELVSEVGRLISFSFRLFGNIFAGEVLLAVVGYFAPYIVPVPLMSFELFVGFIQAAVFSLLTLFFIKLAVMDHGGDHEEAHAH